MRVPPWNEIIFPHTRFGWCAYTRILLTSSARLNMFGTVYGAKYAVITYCITLNDYTRKIWQWYLLATLSNECHKYVL